MMMMRFLSLIGLAICTAGCASAPDQFYMLTADGKTVASRSASELMLGVGPVSVPDYIDRAELVFQSSPNRFEVPPEHRWTGDLKKTITSVLATNIGARKGTGAVYAYPWDAKLKPRFTVPVRIRQFHALSGGDATLDVSWEIIDGISGEVLKRGAKVFAEPLAEEGYDGMVAAESRLLGQLADAIAAMLPDAG